MRHVWRCSFDCLKLAPVHIKPRYCPQQCFCIGMCRMIKNIICTATLHDFSGIHHDNICSKICNNTEIMRDQNDAHLMLFLDFFHHVQNICLHGNIQCGRRLVRNQKRRIQCYGNPYHNALAHSS